jgi:hypothetical protein
LKLLQLLGSPCTTTCSKTGLMVEQLLLAAEDCLGCLSKSADMNVPLVVHYLQVVAVI